ncbi:hypothetical protein [Marinactinospora rubrisoli]|uniref:ARB-07466-like C-terminal domain-containing protein n=1 Tax=Marinactinospora rubrisoli TaxID=2715399 RepID=A0ABW2KER5_9ACTN
MRSWVRGLVGTTAAVAIAAAGVYVGGPWLLERTGLGETALPWGPECAVRLGSETAGLTLEEARRATTAVALEARGDGSAVPEADTAGIDPAVLDRLREGPAGDPGPVLTCRAAPADGLAAEELTESGLTPRAERVRTAMAEVFGEQSLGGFEPGGVSDGHGSDSAHYDGRAIDVFYRPVDEENRRAGWLLAHWLVAHADELDLAVVIFDDRIWSASFSQVGWRPYVSGDTGNDILQHRDHVHVDVQRGEDGAA